MSSMLQGRKARLNVSPHVQGQCGGFVFRESFPPMLTLLLEWKLPSFTDPALLGSVDWLNDRQIIQIGPIRDLA